MVDGDCFLLAAKHVFNGDGVVFGFIGADNDNKRNTFFVGVFKLFVEFVGLGVEKCFYIVFSK